jgi:hypothetical protein
MKVQLDELIRALHAKAQAMHAMADHLNDMKKRKLLRTSPRVSSKATSISEKSGESHKYGDQFNLDDYGAKEFAAFFNLGNDKRK